MARKETMAERKFFKMRKDIHPEYRPVVFMDTSTGYQFLSGSTKRSNETVEFEGETYPLIRVEISSDSHPFYSSRWTRGSFQQKIRSQIINRIYCLKTLIQSLFQEIGIGFFCF